MPAVIRSSVLVNLVWDQYLLIWVIDPCDLDGGPLDTPAQRMSSSDGPYAQLEAADQDQWDLAEGAAVPDARLLARMILGSE